MPSVGVIGETGGRTGDADREFEEEVAEWPCCDPGEVSTVRPGIMVLLKEGMKEAEREAL